MLDIWPEFSASPIMTHFRWSPLIELAFDMNRDIWYSSNTVEPYLTSSTATTNAERYPEIPGLLALHIRRGDFEEHCTHIGNWSSDYVAFNSFPEMPDKFTVPPHEGWGYNSPENHAVYRAHCYPSVAEIVAKVRAVRRTRAGRGLRRAFVMTNGGADYIRELKGALWADGADWELIASSRDLVLNREQKYVAQAVDMLVGQRAQVLIGNGVRRSVFLAPVVLSMRSSRRIFAVLDHDVEHRDDADGEQVRSGEHALLLTTGVSVAGTLEARVASGRAGERARRRRGYHVMRHAEDRRAPNTTLTAHTAYRNITAHM